MARDDDMMTPGDDASDALVPAWTTDGHLDEGTIHTWLDDAFDAAQAAVIAAHVDGCASCRESVAEARGFIAGASRMVRALDAVPSGVVPKADVERVASRIVAAASAASPAASMTPLVRARRAWYTRSAVRAAAAVLLMVAGGSYVMSRSSDKLSRSLAIATNESSLRAVDSAAPITAPAPAARSVPSKLADQPAAERRERRTPPPAIPQAALQAKAEAATSVTSAADATVADTMRVRLKKEEPAQAPVLAAAKAPAPTAPPPPSAANFAARSSTARAMSVSTVDSGRTNERMVAGGTAMAMIKVAEDARSDRAPSITCWSLSTADKAESLSLPNGVAVRDFSVDASVSVTWSDWPRAGRATRVEFRLDGRGTLSALAASDGKELALSLTRNGDGWIGTATTRDAAEFIARTSARPITRRVMMTRAEPSVCKL